MARTKFSGSSSRHGDEEPEENAETRPHSSIASTKEAQNLLPGVRRRTFLYEVAFRPVNTAQLPHFKEDFEAEIEQRGWQRLVEPAPAVNKTIVQEFYANILDQQPSGEVFLRGRWVSFSETAIANYFGFSYRGGDCLYGLEKRTPEQLEEVTRVIAIPGATWNMGSAGNRPTWIKRGLLTNEARNWLRFVDNRLHPNSVSGEITWRRATIIYAIMAGKPINAARVISLFLKGNKKNCGLPGMITAMARQGRVPTKNSDDTDVPAGELEPETLVHVVKGAKRQRISEASSSGAGREDDAPAQPPPTDAPSEMTDLRDRMDRMELFQNYMGVQMDAIVHHFQIPVPSFEEYRTPHFPPPPEE